jgi:hypothetical protein
VALVTTLVLGVPTVKEWSRRWTWYPPLVAFIITGIVTLPVTPNALRARDLLQFYILQWVLITGTAVLVDSARRAELLLKLYGIQFVWWGLWGVRSGQAPWHPLWANYDGFASLMVIGIGICSFLTLASENPRFRRAMMIAVGLAVIGVVASFARGAAFAGVAVFGVVWLRSPRKGRALAAGVICVGLVIAAASLLHGGAYWAELESSFTQGTSEGTGGERWVMWTAAFRVFLQHPVFGVGPSNWGVFASEFFHPGDLPDPFALNPGRLYGRNTHNYHVQVLAEQGVVGMLAYLWMFVDFWRRNAVLRTAAAAQRWKALGGSLHLRPVALGLEAALVGWIAAAGVYAVGGSHLLFSIIALNLLLHSLVTRSSKTPISGARPTSGRSRGVGSLRRRGRAQ